MFTIKSDGMDESLSPNTALYQIWGQNARDKYRYSIRPGSVLLIKQFSALSLQPRTDIDRKYQNNSLLVLKNGDFIVIDMSVLVWYFFFCSDNMLSLHTQTIRK